MRAPPAVTSSARVSMRDPLDPNGARLESAGPRYFASTASSIDSGHTKSTGLTVRIEQSSL